MQSEIRSNSSNTTYFFPPNIAPLILVLFHIFIRTNTITSRHQHPSQFLLHSAKVFEKWELIHIIRKPHLFWSADTTCSRKTQLDRGVNCMALCAGSAKCCLHSYPSWLIACLQQITLSWNDTFQTLYWVSGHVNLPQILNIKKRNVIYTSFGKIFYKKYMKIKKIFYKKNK